MADASRCPRCGRHLPGDAPGGVCPKCLMQQGMESTAGFIRAAEAGLKDGELCGPYRVIRLLGRGGMGAVYEAEHTASGRRLALKILHHRLQSPDDRRRFLREGRLAASVNHPHTVYVYGTEEIDGTPVIAMEPALGGTLQQRVDQEGPLPIEEAVDVVLDIISGLEAAHAVGVLHRDVKPSNCFFDSDGTVKVGDFGLSISTVLRDDANLTQSGVFLGTPAFASPEQLRGDGLDVRSDIYSVGVTLYYLLTGRPPFEAEQMVQLLATVLERAPVSPRIVRPEIPLGLAAIISRCLAKQSGQRYRNYDQLRSALWPFRSAAPSPGTVGLRLVAGVVDLTAIGAVSALLPLLWVEDLATWKHHFEALWLPGPQPTAVLNLMSGIGCLVVLVYHTILEGLWGAAAGKAVCRLRVVGPTREAPGLVRSSYRSFVFVAATFVPFWFLAAIQPSYAVSLYSGDIHSGLDFAVGTACSLSFLFLFVTLRRRNGYGGIHELVSGTRVVRRPALQPRPRLENEEQPLPVTESESRIGPYHVLGPLNDPVDPGLVLAYDMRLLRRVWIRPCPPGTPPVEARLRRLARIGRLRWLNDHRDNDGGWDAYEAPTGEPLLNLVTQPQPWSRVRFWLLDLARELDACRKDNTLPSVLGMDRVWITADGRGKLLDFPAPGIDRLAGDDDSNQLPGAQSGPAQFLKRVAVSALEGQVPPAGRATERSVRAAIPLSGRKLLDGLGRQTRREALPVGEFETLTRQPASVSTQKRIGVFLACWLLPLSLTAIMWSAHVTEREFLKKHPEVGELSGFIRYYKSLGSKDASSAELREAIEVVTTSRFREIVEDPDIWSDPSSGAFVTADELALARRFTATHSALSPSDVAAAQRQLEPAAEAIWLMQWHHDDYAPLLLGLTVAFGAVMVLLVIGPSLVTAVVFGDSLLLRLLEIAIVSEDGGPAPHLRVVWRQAVLWSLVVTGIAMLLLIAWWGRPRVLAVFIVYWIVVMFISERGLHDAIAGTRLVPR